jgi:F0F1-type ATP synthase assembly protein I
LGGVRIDFEVQLIGPQAPIKGTVDFTISICGFIVCVIEAKAEKFDKGRAQSFLEMEVIKAVHSLFVLAYPFRGPKKTLYMA